MAMIHHKLIGPGQRHCQSQCRFIFVKINFYYYHYFLNQNWISGLRSYDGEDGEMSLNTSTHSSLNSPRGQYIVPERLLTPTASSKAKRHTPEGSAATTDDVGKVSEMGDGKLKETGCSGSNRTFWISLYSSDY